jgi:hypothetical protein
MFVQNLAAFLAWAGEGEESLLFLKKKKQKDFLLCYRGQARRHTPLKKVFWFFFSKKNPFLPAAGTEV